MEENASERPWGACSGDPERRGRGLGKTGKGEAGRAGARAVGEPAGAPGGPEGPASTAESRRSGRLRGLCSDVSEAKLDLHL